MPFGAPFGRAIGAILSDAPAIPSPQIRAALLLAEKLKRVLVLPPIVCGLDRFWAPHNGTIPGSRTLLPIDPCPADHVLDLEHIARTRKLEEFLREHSFLQNPKLPAAWRKGGASRAEGVAPPTSLSDKALRPLLALRDTAVLELSSMPDLYATLGAADALAAQTKYKAYTSIWCCSKPPGPKMPGHIWYDMFFDVVPHENRHRRVWQTKWTPEFGP